MTRAELQHLFDAIQSLHVVVIGDVMLDNYWWGEVERISPEAPVPIVSLQRRESRLGGAANVALNCIALGARTTLASVIGDDGDAHMLIKLANDAGIDTSLIQQSSQRPTTTKARVMGHRQQMLRIDSEVTDELTTEEEHPFIDAVLRFLQREKPQVLIFEDYNKGVLKENVIQRVSAHCRELGIITAVDPKRRNFLSYRDVSIFKPNLKEVREGLGLLLDSPDKAALDKVHAQLREKLHPQLVTFITLSERGVYYHDTRGSEIIPSHLRNIADVSGAGDTVVATATLIYAASGCDARLMAQISNLAGGLVCEEVGVVPVSRERLAEEAARCLSQDVPA